MTDQDFFNKTLGLSELWEVKVVRLDLGGRLVELEIGFKAGTVWGQDGLMLPIEGYEECPWRHLDTMQLEKVLRARVPRIRHPDGRTEMVSVSWATPRSRLTVAFEALAIRVLQACGSVNEASRLLRIDWRAAQHNMKRAVRQGLERREVERVENLGIDEKSFRKGHSYGTLLADLDEGRVLEVVEESTTQAAGEALANWGNPVLQGVKAVAMDMSAAYAAAVREHSPQADIVYDKFHVSALFGQAVDTTRRQEHARLKAQGDQILKSSRYDWLYDPGHMIDSCLLNFLETIEDGASVAPPRVVWRVLEPHRLSKGPGIFQTLACMRHSQSPAICSQSGADPQCPSTRPAQPPDAPHHQRHERGFQQPHSEHQVCRQGISFLLMLPNAHSLFLRLP